MSFMDLVIVFFIVRRPSQVKLMYIIQILNAELIPSLLTTQKDTHRSYWKWWWFLLFLRHLSFLKMLQIAERNLYFLFFLLHFIFPVMYMNDKPFIVIFQFHKHTLSLLLNVMCIANWILTILVESNKTITNHWVNSNLRGNVHFFFFGLIKKQGCKAVERHEAQCSAVQQDYDRI